MLKRLEGLFRRRGRNDSPPVPAAGDAVPGLALRAASAEMLDPFLEEVRLADTRGCSPWVLREERQLETFRHALEHMVRDGIWLQPASEGVEHWEGRLMSLYARPTEPLGFLLACRPEPETAWQFRFFCVREQWQGQGHGQRLLKNARDNFEGEPCVARLPVSCEAGVRCLEAAGFERQREDPAGVMHYEAAACWAR